VAARGRRRELPPFHALLATLAVSVLPVLVILCIPLLKTDKKTGTTAVNAPLLRGLLAFAVGGLLGDALLHLLPHALAIETPDAVGCYTLGGILAFFALEKVIRGFHRFDGTAARKKDDDHPTAAAASSDSHAAHCHTHEGDAVGGILNLVADFSHNWTDGMALAAAFAAGHRVGLSTALAVFLHEIPHEVGDYALLVQSGMTQRRAMLLQFVTAIGALLGCLVGLVAGDRYEGFEGFVLPFTAGGFLYIALAETVPVLMQGVSLTRTQAIIEALACGAGVGAMVAIGYFE
jgi:zinc transporter 7